MDTKPPSSPTEERIHELLRGNPHVYMLPVLGKELQHLVLSWDRRGISREVQACAAVAHLTSMLAALKMTHLVRGELVDQLCDDLFDTVKGRTVPGVLAWLTPQ